MKGRYTENMYFDEMANRVWSSLLDVMNPRASETKIDIAQRRLPKILKKEFEKYNQEKDTVCTQ